MLITLKKIYKYVIIQVVFTIILCIKINSMAYDPVGNLTYHDFSDSSEITINSLDNGKYKINGKDPYIVFENSNIFCKEIVVEFDEIKNISGLSIYYNTGDGYIESQHIKMTKINENKYVVKLKENIISFRIDIDDFINDADFKICRVDVYENTSILIFIEQVIIFSIINMFAIIAMICLEVMHQNKKSIIIYLKVILSIVFQYVFYKLSYIVDVKHIWIMQLILIAVCVLCFVFDWKKYKKIDMFTIVVCISAGLMYFLWSNIIPYNHAPDEYMRYMIPQYIFEYGKLPAGNDPLIMDSNWGTSYGFTPITSYIISAFFMKITNLFCNDQSALLIAARFTSVIFSVGTVYLCCKIGEKCFKGIFSRIFVISIAFLPEFIFISSYVNTDAFGIFTVSAVIYTFLVCNEKNWCVSSCIWLGISMGLCLISYSNCYGILIVAFLFALYSTITNKEIEHKLKFIISRILLVFGVVMIVSAWWFIRNAILYNGDFLGMEASKACSETNAVDYLKPSNRRTPYVQGWSLWTMLYDMGWIESSMRSFIAGFDYMSLFLGKIWYIGTYIVCLFGIIGNVLYGNKEKIKKLGLFMLTMCAITVALSVYYSYFNDFQAQGRYCLPMIVSLHYILCIGWEKLARMSKRVYKKIIPGMVILMYSMLCLVSVYTIINAYV